ncbi:two-component system sensor histidine kinase YesM [Paenibacillus sp. BK033]|uniref:sensor histidine kinase n=2 Tax=unclassified Paenibacillus TaxID=185978 RepID=UPI001052194B|nr:sensor histidine kinase [Paenibacillus sp. BK033]TCM93270.1 two-component system sensor histidine kinase YesM [Paenibacillus sp. BK033]
MNRLFPNKINDIPLNLKFLMIYVLCILIPIIGINVFFYQQNSDNIRIREQENLRKSMDRAAAELHSMIDESVAVSHSIEGDDSLNEVLDKTYDSPVSSYESYDSVLRNKLKRYMPVYPNILEIRIYTYNHSIQTGNNYYVINAPEEASPWLGPLLRQPGHAFRVVAYSEESGTTGPAKKISVISDMDQGFSIVKPQYRKFLRIDLNVDKIYDILSRESDSLQLELVNEQNQVVAETGGRSKSVYDADMSDWAKGDVFVSNLGTVSYVQGWKLIGRANNDRIATLLDEARRSILWLAVISTLIPSLLIFVMLRSYHYRIKKLARHMDRVRNERFDQVTLPEGKDEIGGLINTYNMMTRKINTLINDVYKLEIHQKSLEVERVRMEMNMLQSQMNPHFLFNTLNALLVVATKNGYKDVTEIIKSLSLLLRRLLRRADDLVPLKEELQFTLMYLQIEKFRFGDRFDYVVDIDPLANDVRVPIMSIQPLAENACKHGLQAIKGGGSVRIEARLSERGLTVSVADNGIGMEQEALDRIQQAVRSEQAMEGHVGLRNVYRRLELFYHESVQFRMMNGPEGGLTVSYQIPLQQLEHNQTKPGAAS